MPSVIEGYKDLSAYFNAWTGRDLSPEAFRKWVERDPDWKSIVRTVSGRPGVPRYLFDRWIVVTTKRKRGRPRNAVKAVVEWFQMFLI